MKNWLIVTLLVITSFGVKAGNFDVEIDHFTGVLAMGNFKVTLKKGDVDKVEVINNDEDIIDEKIVCEVEKDVLKLRLKGDTYKERDIEIIVTYTDLSQITSKLGCRLTVEGEMGVDEIEFNSESGGKIKATVASKKVKASISAGGSIRLSGEVDEVEYKISAGGTIGAVSLKANEVKAQVTAGGEIICSVKSVLAIKITSGGNVAYIGDPEGYEQNITLGGKITKMKNPE